MRLDLDEYRRQVIECAGGKVSDFYNQKDECWKIGKASNDCHLVMDAYDLCHIEHLIQNAYKAGLLDGLDEKDMACKNAFRDGALHAKMEMKTEEKLGIVREMLND